MENVAWAFNRGVFPTQDAFNERIRDYQIAIKKEDGWNADEVVFSHPSIQICYEYWTADEDEVEEVIELKADNKEFFTKGELLFKLHNAVVDNLENGDHIFFEGLTLSDTEFEDKPFYWMYLGS